MPSSSTPNNLVRPARREADTRWKSGRTYTSRAARSLRRGLVENFVRCRRDHLDIFGNERPAIDIFYELRLDLVREHLADARVLFDVGPLCDQEETLRILGVAAQHPILHLRPGLVHGIAVRIIELFEQADELFLLALGHTKIIDVQKIALCRERFLRHGVLLFAVDVTVR